MKMTLMYVVVFALTLMAAIGVVNGHYTDVYYMPSVCDTTLGVRGDAILLKMTSYTRSTSCSVRLTSNIGDRLVIRFLSYNVGCSSAALDVYDPYTRSYYSKEQCGSIYTDREFYSQMESNDIKLTFKTKSSSFIYQGFSILITSYNTGYCGYNKFSCSNGRCIPSSLKCDGYNNCGDNSDEHCYMTTGSISGIVVGVIIFIIIIVALSMAGYRRRYRGVVFGPARHGPCVTTINTVAPPPYGTMPPPYGAVPPQYPQNQHEQGYKY